MDQFRAMTAFVRVIDEGSFAKAARALDLTPPVITRLVSDLEQALGTRLIHRTTRRLALTAVGAQYLERARQILADLEEANTQAMTTTGQLRGVLRVSGPLPFLVHQVAPRLPAFRERYPGVDFEVTAAAMLEAPDENADVTLLLSGPRPIDGDFVARRLAHAQIVFCATPDYLDRHGRPQSPADLDAHQLLVPNVSFAPREWTFRRVGDGRDGAAQQVVGVLRRSAISSTSTDLLLAAARAGMGIAGTLSYSVADALREGSLERVLADWSVGHYVVHAAMPTRKYLPLRTRVFTDFLVEAFGGEERDPWLTGCNRAE
ncbi:LysR family transcriptional regulator [Caldimonas sp. KR1-144]|uniref:LysR family transcriptional regulator n=1 Tax=Caldimonas sp. KR1-144 TaxID=3400911 RepID=UPI003C0B86AB